jgi:hypothetical protein
MREQYSNGLLFVVDCSNYSDIDPRLYWSGQVYTYGRSAATFVILATINTNLNLSTAMGHGSRLKLPRRLDGNPDQFADQDIRIGRIARSHAVELADIRAAMRVGCRQHDGGLRNAGLTRDSISDSVHKVEVEAEQLHAQDSYCRIAVIQHKGAGMERIVDSSAAGWPECVAAHPDAEGRGNVGFADSCI